MVKSFPQVLAVILSLAVANAQTTAPRPPVLPDTVAGPPAPRSTEYAQLQERLQHGWNTWDTTTIAGEVLLPEGLEVNIGLKNNRTQADDAYLPNILIGRKGKGDEQVKPGPHSFNGSYSSFDLTWSGVIINIQSGHAGDDLVMLVNPIEYTQRNSIPMTVLFSVGFLWNKPGHIERDQSRIVATGPRRAISIYLTDEGSHDVYNDLKTPYFSAALDQPIGISTGKPRSIEEIKQALNQQLVQFKQSHQKSPEVDPVLEAIETTIGWDTIYEPGHDRVISPVSRRWNESFGGYVLFDWDTFFASSLAATGSRDLAYANALEILNEETPAGFIEVLRTPRLRHYPEQSVDHDRYAA
jgi:putative isomerase